MPDAPYITLAIISNQYYRIHIFLLTWHVVLHIISPIYYIGLVIWGEFDAAFYDKSE